MSETTTEDPNATVVEVPEPSAATHASAEQPSAEPASAEAQPATEAPQEPAEPEAPKEPPWFVKRIGAMTRQNAELARERDLYKAMVDGRQAAPEADRSPAPQPGGQDVETRARQIVAEQQDEARRLSLVTAGQKELGEAAWTAKADVLHSLGATTNPAFMRAIVAVPEGHKLVSALADSPEKAVALLAMGQVEMAAELGRMSAEMSAPPKPRAISAAPRPIAPVTGRAQPEQNVYDENMSMAEYAALRARTAPAHLGGQRRRG